MVIPSDESARERFATELSRNFSVVASAGSGKTTAITKRVLSIARSSNAAELLTRLVVVTFANRAADEMQQRARQILLEEKYLDARVQTAFNRAFFGTIHSFCMKLLTEFGHYLGLPSPLDLLGDDDDDLWAEFRQSQTRIGVSLGDADRTKLLRLVQARDLMELARRARSAVLNVPELSACPKPNFDEVHAQTDISKSNDNISKSQAELREWENRYAGDWEYLRWPPYFTADNSKFTHLWREKFSPLRKWVSDAATCVAVEVQRAYREFRLERGLVTYGDQIALAKELLQHPQAAARIRDQNFVVILDEAQDTEPAQFSVLLESTRPPEAQGHWMETRVDPPRPGHFCMVGDFQQSIYRERADLPYYQSVHEAIVKDAGGEALTFSVTFRLDEEQLRFVNETFREILNDDAGQVRFVELHPRPDILPGKVIRVPIVAKELLPEGKKLKDYQKARIEAKYLAAWIRDAGLEKLSADSWREVAILCPRKAWLQTMAAALRQIDLPVSIQSERDVNGDSPAYAWLAALLTVMSDPRNAYEIVGVLREIFGVSDHDLAVFSDPQQSRFRIDEVPAAVGKVSSHLRTLAEIRRNAEGLALFDAVAAVVVETQLRDRLLALPAAEFGDLSRELDALLAQAAEADAGGMILSEFAERLRDDFNAARAVRFSTDDNAIQLITSHKAKGSEWQAVIVPFLARDLRPYSPSYPHFVKPPKGGPPLLALGKEDKSKELKEEIERAQAQELERLLYVATTRARRTLVLALDQEIFSNNECKLPRTAQLRRLVRNADSYAGQFDEISRTIENVGPFETLVAPLEKPETSIEPLAPRELQRAKSRGAEFVQKFIPSSLEEEVDAEIRPRSRLDNPATLYGHWWHRFFERLRWQDGLGSARELFEEQLPSSPDPKAATKDWKATSQNLFSDTRIAAYLSRGTTRFEREYPFSWQINEKTVLEGFIDLLMIDRDANRCLLIDWKTNRIKPGNEESLRQRYRPQIAAYWMSLREITKLEIEAGIFATATGEFIPYLTTELEAEWERLRAMPPERLSSVAASLLDA
jgi:ATP-dependent exoDNAse (exonuclease V) beta subunit